jgi:outer membrane protein
VSLLACSVAAQAQDNIVKLGIIRYTTNSSTTGIKGIGIPPGADAETGNATAILVYERTLTPNIGVELVLGIPPTHQGQGHRHRGLPRRQHAVGEERLAHAALQLLLRCDASDTWRPYLGAGINYTRFTDIKSSLAPKVDMSDSWGAAFQAGVNYAINKQWGLFASVARIDVKSDVVAVGSTVLTTSIDFKPVTYSWAPTTGSDATACARRWRRELKADGASRRVHCTSASSAGRAAFACGWLTMATSA